MPWMVLFAIAMAWLESAVVVYLRELYYPDGFRFPLVPIGPRVAWIELGREAATLVMLFAPGALVARRRLLRFAWFCVLFGVWDLFYYIWLKAFLDWPTDLLTPDILFLIPTPWVGPVLAPCIVALGLIGLGTILLQRAGSDPSFTIGTMPWIGLLIGALTILGSFLVGPVQHLLSAGFGLWSIDPGNGSGLGAMGTYVPGPFPWWEFLLGCSFAGAGIFSLVRSSGPRSSH